MRPYVREHKLGRVLSEQEFEFGKDAYGRDISFFGPERQKLYDGQLRVQRFVPDLAIEIVSPGERFETLMEKIQIYRSCGVREAYIFSMLTRQAFRYSEQPPVILTESQEFRPEQIPGFIIRIADLLLFFRICHLKTHLEKTALLAAKLSASYR